MGNPELVKLWEAGAKYDASAEGTSLPPIKPLIDLIVEEGDAEAEIEPQYRHINDPAWHWKVLITVKTIAPLSLGNTALYSSRPDFRMPFQR